MEQKHDGSRLSGAPCPPTYPAELCPIGRHRWHLPEELRLFCTRWAGRPSTQRKWGLLPPTGGATVCTVGDQVCRSYAVRGQTGQGPRNSPKRGASEIELPHTLPQDRTKTLGDSSW